MPDEKKGSVSDMKDHVKKAYGDIAKKKKACCGPTCCTDNNPSVSEIIGYSKKELEALPEGADMGLGCGNPVALASLKKGEVVVDLGSGGGIDAFLAANRVGETGRVIGIDMTEAMVAKARANTEKTGFKNVEFKLGDIEAIPLENNIADCIISNCVINLAHDKQKVFNESFRILKPGGRLMVSDMVLLAELPAHIKDSEEMYSACISGALMKDDYLDKIKQAGFKDVKVVKEDAVRVSNYIGSDKVISEHAAKMTAAEIKEIDNAVSSIKVWAVK